VELKKGGKRVMRTFFPWRFTLACGIFIREWIFHEIFNRREKLLYKIEIKF